MESLHIRELVKGYKNHAAELGYCKRGAVPFTEADMMQLLHTMYLQLQNTTCTDQLLMIRDGFIFSLLWQSCFRGFNAGSVRLANIVLPTGGSALPFLLPQTRLPMGAQLHIIPDATKNRKGGHCNIDLTCDLLCFSFWLQLLIHSYAAAGHPVTNWITRPLTSSGKSFTEAPMSSSATWARITKYLKQWHVYWPECAQHQKRQHAAPQGGQASNI